MPAENGIISKPSWLSGSFFESLTLTEFGFLWSIAFAPWGPLLRYAGWILAMTGLALGYKRGVPFGKQLDPIVGIPLALVLLWGALVSFFFKPDMHDFLKTYSLIVEFAFSLWLAARVYSEKNLDRTVKVLFGSAAVVVGQSLWLFLFRNHFAGPFSNIHNLGLYAVIVLPLAISCAFAMRSILLWLLSGGLIFLTILGSSTSFWIIGTFELFLLLLMCGRDFPKKLMLMFLCFLVIFCSAFFLMEKTNPPLFRKSLRSFSREINQVTSIHNPKRFSSSRSIVWQGAGNMVKERPITGWGWKSFSSELAEVNSSWWNDATEESKGIRVVTNAHNMYLNLAIYGGLPTCLLITWIFIYAAYNAFSLSRRDPRARCFWVGISVTVLAFLVYSLAGDVFDVRYKYACIFWYLIGFASRKRMLGVDRDATMSPVEV